MSGRFRSCVLMGVTIGVVMSCTAPVLALRPAKAFFHGERYINETVAEALCLRKIVYDWVINPGSVSSDKFSFCDVVNVGAGYQMIECTGGSVTPGDIAEVRFSGTALHDGTAEVVCAKWYTNEECTDDADYATLVGSIRPDEQLTRAPLLVDVDIVVKHDASHWDDLAEDRVPTTDPVLGSDVYFAEWQGNLHESDMTEVLWTCVDESNNPPSVGSRTECWSDADCTTVSPYLYCGRYDEGKEGGAGGIDWQQPATEEPLPFTLAPGTATLPFELGAYRHSKQLLFRYYSDHAHEYGTSDYEVVQFRVSDWFIPTVSEWGLVVMGVLLLTGGTIVYMRRRALAARA